jgi:putative transcriptional regulator
MPKRTRRNARLDAELLEMAQDMRGTLLSAATADKITMRVLGDRAPARPGPLKADEIRRLREKAGMSQAVFARYLNLTAGYLSQLERGAKQPTGAALALLHVIRRKGIGAIL